MIQKYFYVLILVYSLQICHAQDSELFQPINFQTAIAKQTRTNTGVPGNEYWQNTADYSITLDYNPTSRFLSGKETIRWKNNSPDTLDYLLLHLFPNLYKKGNPRDIEIAAEDLTDGVHLLSMTVNSKIVDLTEDSKMLEEEFTFDWINLRTPILPHSENDIEISWEYTLNKGSHMRTGQVDDGSGFVAYFYPRIGVYDDINGWNAYEYLGTAEFYNDFANYDVRIKVPQHFIVWATGQLQNPAEVLSNKYYLRYQDCLTSDNIVHIVDSSDLKYKDITSPAPYNTFSFKASHVSDFAFAYSDHYLWDAVQLHQTSDQNNTVLLNTAYNSSSSDFYKVVYIAKKSIEYMSNTIPAIPFPFPEMTVFNGLDEMEYPMMVNDNSLPYINETFSLTAHEIYHSYFPFATGCNERKYAWMDEGLTSYFEFRLMEEITKKHTPDIYLMDDYLDAMGSETDLPLFSNSESIKDEVYFNLSYSKAAMFYSVLNAELGDQEFLRLIQEFFNTWEGKHPSGTDFLNFMAHFGEYHLDALIKPWFFEYGYVDLSIRNAEITGDHLSVDIERLGKLPAQVSLQVKYTNGDEEMIEAFKPNSWMKGEKDLTTSFQLHGEPQWIKLGFPLPMDAHPEDNVFEF